MALRDTLSRLKENPSGHSFTASPIRELGEMYLAADALGHPCVFVAAGQRLGDPPIRTSGIMLVPDVEYILTLEDGAERKGRYHLLMCMSTRESDVETFLVLLDPFLRQQRNTPGPDRLVEFFHSVARLFAVGPAKNLDVERQGLWGELFVMSTVRGFTFWAPFWHSEPSRPFDFSGSSKQVEVKSTVNSRRVHHFSHRQIYRPEGDETIIASLLLREDEAGLSLGELIQQSRDALRDTPYFLKIERAARSAGMEVPAESGPRYNAKEAAGNIAWFRACDVPHFGIPEPAGVSETHYLADLSHAPSVSQDGVLAWLAEGGWVVAQP